MDLLGEYGVHITFIITDLIPFVGGYDYDEPVDLRTNPLQEGEDDDLGPTIGLIKGLVTRSMLGKTQEGMDCNVLVENYLLKINKNIRFIKNRIYSSNCPKPREN